MMTMREARVQAARCAVAAVVVGATVVGGSGTAFAHSNHVNTPSGQSNCQFLGGPGNPGHAGHANGHTQAIEHEQSDTVQFGAPCD